MTRWKTGALAAALVAAACAGGAFMPAPRAQERSRESFARAFRLIAGGSQIGVTVRDVDPDDAAKAGGIIVEEVSKDSPAEKAGIKSGDRIVEFDAERVRSVAQFRRLVQETPEDRKVPIVLQRGSERISASVTPDSRRGIYFGDDFLPTPPAAPAPPRIPMAPAPPAPPRVLVPRGFEDFVYHSADARLGASLESMSDQLRDYFGVKEGVLVTRVRTESVASKAGLKAGDVVTAINGRHVSDPSDVGEALRRAESGSDLTIEIARDRKAQTLKGKLEPRDDRPRSRTGTPAER